MGRVVGERGDSGEQSVEGAGVEFSDWQERVNANAVHTNI